MEIFLEPFLNQTAEVFLCPSWTNAISNPLVDGWWGEWDDPVAFFRFDFVILTSFAVYYFSGLCLLIVFGIFWANGALFIYLCDIPSFYGDIWRTLLQGNIHKVAYSSFPTPPEFCLFVVVFWFDFFITAIAICFNNSFFFIFFLG